MSDPESFGFKLNGYGVQQKRQKTNTATRRIVVGDGKEVENAISDCSATAWGTATDWESW